eukprot:gene4024-5032_t
MEQVVSNELDYRPLLVSEPEYEYTRLFPQSGTTYTTVSAGGNDTIFEVPPSKAYNLGKSWFQFTFILPAIIRKDLSSRGIEYHSFTSIYQDKVNLVEVLMSSLQEGGTSPSNNQPNQVTNQPLRKPGVLWTSER